MIEIEILVEVKSSYQEALHALSNLEFIKEEKITDVYFYDPLRDTLKPDSTGKTFACLRVRKESSGSKLTFKQDVYKNNKWQYSEESETSIEDDKIVSDILFSLGLKQLLVLDNERKYYKYEKYEIVLEKVKNLGVFMEVEYKGELSNITQNDFLNIKQEIYDFINSINIIVSSELNSGKPELYIQRHNISIL